MSERTRADVLRECTVTSGTTQYHDVNALADRVLALESALADARRERDEAVLNAAEAEARAWELGIALEDCEALRSGATHRADAAEREREAMRAVVTEACEYADMLVRYEYGDDVSDHNDGLIEAVRAYRTATAQPGGEG